MFLKSSRYAQLPVVAATDAAGREVSAVRLRRLPATDGTPQRLAAHDQLDVIAEQRYADPTRFWHVADANSELDSARLARPAGRTIKVPES